MLIASIAQLGERQTEDLKVPGSIPGGGIVFFCFSLTRRLFKYNEKNTSSGIRTRNPRIRSPMRYPLRHGGNKLARPWWDSNPQPLDPKSSALSIAPQGLVMSLAKSMI